MAPDESFFSDWATPAKCYPDMPRSILETLTQELSTAGWLNIANPVLDKGSRVKAACKSQFDNFLTHELFLVVCLVPSTPQAKAILATLSSKQRGWLTRKGKS
jgi:hypothetical protein